MTTVSHQLGSWMETTSPRPTPRSSRAVARRRAHLVETAEGDPGRSVNDRHPSLATARRHGPSCRPWARPSTNRGRRQRAAASAPSGSASAATTNLLPRLSSAQSAIVQPPPPAGRPHGARRAPNQASWAAEWHTQAPTTWWRRHGERGYRDHRCGPGRPFARVRVDHDNKAFYRGWLEKRLLMNRCANCGRWHHPPKPICPIAGRPTSADRGQRTGRGAPAHAAASGTGGAGRRLHAGPHPVATVELVEQVGPRYTSTVIGVPVGEIHIGMPVELTWIERDGVPFPVFQPAGILRKERGWEPPPRIKWLRRCRHHRLSPRRRRPLLGVARRRGVGRRHPRRRAHRQRHRWGRRGGRNGRSRSLHQLAAMLELPTITHHARPAAVAGFAFIDAVNAIVAGSCDTVLVCLSMMRTPGMSRSSASDPFRRNLAFGVPIIPEHATMAAAYAAWASRYIYEFGARREDFGYVAVNDRTNAGRNPLAAMRSPLTMDDYLAARMIREPLCLLDMDVPVDGADAFVLTTAERAKARPIDRCWSTPRRPAWSATTTRTNCSTCAVTASTSSSSGSSRRATSGSTDVDVFLAYDGFTIITLGWIENTGWCAPGGAGRFLEGTGTRKPTGCSSTAGSRSTRMAAPFQKARPGAVATSARASSSCEATPGTARYAGARSALVTPGGFFFNSQGIVLRSRLPLRFQPSAGRIVSRNGRESPATGSTGRGGPVRIRHRSPNRSGRRCGGTPRRATLPRLRDVALAATGRLPDLPVRGLPVGRHRRARTPLQLHGGTPPRRSGPLRRSVRRGHRATRRRAAPVDQHHRLPFDQLRSRPAGRVAHRRLRRRLSTSIRSHRSEQAVAELREVAIAGVATTAQTRKSVGSE